MKADLKVYGEGLARVINPLHVYVEEFTLFNILATGAACLIYAVYRLLLYACMVI